MTVGVQLGSCFPFLKSGVARSIGLDKECLVVVIYVGKGQVVGVRKSIGVVVGVCGCVFVFLGVCLYWCEHLFRYVCGCVFFFMVLSVWWVLTLLYALNVQVKVWLCGVGEHLWCFKEKI